MRLLESYGSRPCVTQLKAHGPSRTCNESKEEKEHGKSHQFAPAEQKRTPLHAQFRISGQVAVWGLACNVATPTVFLAGRLGVQDLGPRKRLPELFSEPISKLSSQGCVVSWGVITYQCYQLDNQVPHLFF